MNLEDVFQRIGGLSEQIRNLAEDVAGTSRRIEAHIDDDTDKNAKIARELGEISTELKRIGKVEDRQWEENSKAGNISSDRPRRKSVSDRALLLLIAALIPLAQAVKAITEHAWPPAAPPAAAASHP